MKFVKMSLAAAMLMGASAYAIENVKISGDASLYYHTQDADVIAVSTPDMFEKGASNADIGFSLGVTADLTPGVSAGLTVNALTTLGVEGTLVNGVWSGAHTVTGNPLAALTVEVDDTYWASEAWVAGTLGKTTAKVGRMALDTPLAFTETWGIAPNTFEAAVLINQDIPATTLVGAYVGKSNGAAMLFPGGNPVALTSILTSEATFHEFWAKGAYAVGAINNSFEPLTVQGWYYDVQSIADAYWLQADLNIAGFLAGVQYTEIDVDDLSDFGLSANNNDDKAWAAMLGYALKDVVTVKLAYSEVDETGSDLGGVANIATTTGASKLYTELWWNFGAADTGAKTWALTADATVGGVDLFAGYYETDVEAPAAALGTESEVTEYVVTAGKAFGPLDATVAVIYDAYDHDGGNVAGDTEDVTALQLYLTYNF